MDPNLKLLLVIVVTASVSYGFARLGAGRDKKSGASQKDEESKATEARKQAEEIAELSKQVAVLTAKAVPIDAAYAAMLIAKMTHLHTPVMDALLEKMSTDLDSDADAKPTLTTEDAAELDAGLKEKIDDPSLDEAERIAAKILPDVVRLAVLAKEQEVENKTETVLVTRPATQTTTTSAGPAEEEK